MRRVLGVGLAFAMCVRSTAAGADPTAPQLDPTHAHREDAQRIEDQQRGLDRSAAAARVPTPPDLTTPTVVTDRTRVVAGGVLLGVAALSAAASLTVAPLDSSTSGDNQGTYDTLLKVFVATAVLSGVAGYLLLMSSRSTVRVAPAVSPHSVGLAIMGRI